MTKTTKRKRALKARIQELQDEIKVLIEYPTSIDADMIRARYQFGKDLEKAIWYGSPTAPNNP